MSPAIPQSMSRHRARGAAGFTLIEVILAIGIFAIVMVSINTAFFAALRLRQKTSETIENSLPLTQALGSLRRDLQNAMPPGGTMVASFRGGAATLNTSSGNLNSTAAGAKGTPATMGANQGTGLDFYASTGKLSDDEPWGDIQQVNYQLVDSEDRSKPGKQLVRSVARNLLATASEMADTRKLAGNIESMELLFFDGLQWRDQWDTTSGDTGLPLAVRVRIYLVPPETSTVRHEPVEMLVLLPATGSTTNQTTASVTQ